VTGNSNCGTCSTTDGTAANTICTQCFNGFNTNVTSVGSCTCVGPSLNGTVFNATNITNSTACQSGQYCNQANCTVCSTQLSNCATCYYGPATVTMNPFLQTYPQYARILQTSRISQTLLCSACNSGYSTTAGNAGCSVNSGFYLTISFVLMALLGLLTLF